MNAAHLDDGGDSRAPFFMGSADLDTSNQAAIARSLALGTPNPDAADECTEQDHSQQHPQLIEHQRKRTGPYRLSC
jgi:hypothetical protein